MVVRNLLSIWNDLSSSSDSLELDYSDQLESTAKSEDQNQLPIFYPSIDSRRYLNKGGTSEVYTLSSNGEKIVLKSIFLNARGNYQAYENEIKILGLLRAQIAKQPNPYIIKCYGYNKSECYGSMFFEYAHQNVESYLDLNPTDTDALARIATETANGFNYLHTVCRIIHRDLKPSNLMLDEFGHVKVIDFGYSVSIDEATKPFKSICGTARFVAPETWADQTYSIKTDVFAMAMCLYDFFVQEFPYPEIAELDTTEEQIRAVDAAITQGKRPNIAGFFYSKHPQIINLIEDCWDQEPTKRPTMAEIENRLRPR